MDDDAARGAGAGRRKGEDGHDDGAPAATDGGQAGAALPARRPALGAGLAARERCRGKRAAACGSPCHRSAPCRAHRDARFLVRRVGYARACRHGLLPGARLGIFAGRPRVEVSLPWGCHRAAAGSPQERSHRLSHRAVADVAGVSLRRLRGRLHRRPSVPVFRACRRPSSARPKAPRDALRPSRECAQAAAGPAVAIPPPVPPGCLP